MTARPADEFTYDFPDMQPSKRLRELVLYIAQRCADDPTFGVTKLNKILYFSDVEAYRKTGRPITGAEYLKQDYGPVPKAINRIKRELQEQRAINIQEEPLMNYKRHRIVAQQDPDLELFDDQDLSVINDVITQLWGQRAQDVSDASHGMAWRLTDDLDSIPYEASLLTDEALTPAQLEWIGGQIEEYERSRRGPDHP